MPVAGWPGDTYFTEQKDLFFDGTKVRANADFVCHGFSSCGFVDVLNALIAVARVFKRGAFRSIHGNFLASKEASYSFRSNVV